ncbi:SpoIID/LytB domain-containing protein [Cryptosporangium sp. NPDC048952]|uniref:SpoIID/LytB domain-containing protein n=1 Tax=Cryptosporangium sp. NPDC048952 TaxID=3363961 RepID=UPI00371DCB60
MARNTTARRWAIALPATVVAAVAGGIALAPAAVLPSANSSAQPAAKTATAPIAAANAAATAAAAADDAPNGADAAATGDAPAEIETAAAVAAGTTVKGAAIPAKVSVRTVALGSASSPTTHAKASTTQPAGVPLAFNAATDQARVLRTLASGTPFSAVGVTWQRDASLGKVSVAVRTRAETSAPFSAWTTVASSESDDRNGTNAVPAELRDGPGVIWTGDAVTAEVVVTTVSGRQPVDVKVDLIDPGTDTPTNTVTDGDEVAQSDALVPAATAQPTPTTYGNGVVKIYSRAAWGANAAYMKWTPAYAPKVNAIVVHHTATANNYTADQVPAIIRSIYYYMAVTEKYGDVGYNVLIDRFGRIWEGRYGGLTRAVVGAHAGGFNTGTSGIGIIGDHTKVAVSAAAKEAVARYSAFKLGTGKVSPVGTAKLTGGPSTKFKTKTTLTLPTIYPHQSTSATTCPGKYGLNIMAWVRTRAKALVTAYKLGAATVAPAPVVNKPTTPATPAAPVKPATTPTTPPTATANNATVPATGLTVYGAGFGHGRGLSQYGAKGAATQGLNAAQIVNFYYPGTTLAAKGNPSIRVRLSAIDAGTFTFTPVAGLVATDAGKKVVALDAQAWNVTRSGSNYVVKAGAKTYTLVAPVTFTGPKTLKLTYGKAKGDCRGGTTVTFDGTLTALVADNASRFVATMPLDTYLKGVVASEMPSSWPAAALQAQTIAARTYAAAKITASRYYDVVDTQANQCWDGALSETAATNAAIAATVGKVLTVNGKVISAEFSSDSGGYTASGGVAYLPAKADPYTLAAQSSGTNWTKVVTPAQLATAAGLTTVTAVTVTKRTGLGRWGGRAETVTLTGTLATGKVVTVSLTGDAFRIKLGLRSTYLGFAK